MFHNVASFPLCSSLSVIFLSLFFNVSSFSIVFSFHCPVICHDFSQFSSFVYHFLLFFSHFIIVYQCHHCSIIFIIFLSFPSFFYHLPITFMTVYHFHLFLYQFHSSFSLIFMICRFHQSSQLLRRIALSCEASFDSGPPAPPKNKSQKEFHPFVRPLMRTKLYTLSLNPDCKNCEP